MWQGNPVEVQYAYRMEDFENITEAASKTDPRWRRHTRNRNAFRLIGATLFLLPFLASGNLYHPDWSFWPVLPLGAGLLYAGGQTPTRIARKQYRNSLFPYDYRAEISDSGIITISPAVRTELKWQAFSQCIEADGVIALVYEAAMYLFPRRAFTEQQWQEFRALISKHLAQAAN